MRLTWKHVRLAFGWVAGAIVTVLVLTPLGEFVIVYLHKHHVYDDPDRTLASVLAWTHGVTKSAPFQWGGGLVIGFAIGAWLDAIFGRPGRRKSLGSAEAENATEIRSPTAAADAAPPRTLHDLYQQDFRGTSGSYREVQCASAAGNASIEARICVDMAENAKFLVFYVPSGANWSIKDIAAQHVVNLSKLGLGAESKELGDVEMINSSDAIFTGRIFIYHEDILSIEELAEYKAIFLASAWFPQFRGHDYWFSHRHPSSA
jgi:hypothetical protein